MAKLGGWWRLWIVFAVLWIGACLYFFPEKRELDPPSIYIGRIGDIEGITHMVLADSAAQCERWGIGQSVRFEKRIGIPANSKQESDAASGQDDPNFPSWPKDKKLNLPETERQPYLIARTTCSPPGTLAELPLRMFGPPLALLALGLVSRWIWRGFRPKRMVTD